MTQPRPRKPRPPLPAMVHLSDQVMAALREASTADGAMATPDVARAVGRNPHLPETWRALDWLERHGQVERVPHPYGAATWWRPIVAAPDVDPVDLEALLGGDQ